MRFAAHLMSHLTPEWRKQYIDYDSLKKMVYQMVGRVEAVNEADIEMEDPTDLLASEGKCGI